MKKTETSKVLKIGIFRYIDGTLGMGDLNDKWSVTDFQVEGATLIHEINVPYVIQKPTQPKVAKTTVKIPNA